MYEYNQEFYSSDRRVGEQFLANSKDVYDLYNADLISFVIQPADREIDFDVLCGMGGFRVFSDKTSYKKATAEFYVGGANTDETLLNISNLTKLLRNCVIHKGDSLLEYPALLINVAEIEDTDVEYFARVKYELAVVVRMPLVSVSISGSQEIYNPGNTASGVRYTIRPTKAITSFTIAGITIKDLAAGATYIIDGIVGKITKNGANYFQKTNLINFPKIGSGDFKVQMSESVSVTVEFYPVFI